MDTKMNPVNWFEIPVKDLNKAKRFYESVFGFALNVTEMGPSKMAWFPMTPGAPGAGGTLISADGYTQSQSGTLVYFSVGDINTALKKVTASGGRTLMEKTGIGEHGFIARFEDCEGNRVALHSQN